MYKKTILKNGLKIVSHNMGARESVALGIWINIGGRYESDKNKGISHYLEHLLFKGTKKYSCRQIKESIEGIGGALNGFTSEELTCYLVKIPARYLELALRVLSDMVLNPTLPAGEVTKERTVILEELKMYRDQPQSYVYELLDELLWPAQPLGAPIIGTHESVNSITRNDLYAFRKRHYTSSNIVVSAAGSVNHDKLSTAVAAIFSGNREAERNTFIRVIEKQQEPQLNIFDKDTEQTHLALGFHGFHRTHPLRHALGILHIILGANMSSRLFNEVREKRGLAYEIGTAVKRYSDTGAFIVHAGIDNGKVEQAIALIIKELSKAKSRPVTKDEFRRAKEFYTGQLALALEDTLDHMLWMGESLAATNKLRSLKDVMDEVGKVRIKDVSEAADKVLRQSNANLALIGPLKNKHASIRGELRIS